MQAAPATKQPRVVAIAGGDVAAIEQVLREVPVRSGLAYVVVAQLAKRPDSKLPLQPLDGTTSLEPDRVYLVPPDREVVLADGALAVVEPKPQVRAPADRLMRSLADHLGDGAIAVVVSGEGVDGASGVKRIKEAGGLTLCQDPAQARLAAMPTAAIATGGVDLVLPLEAIGPELVRLASEAELQRTRDQLQSANEALTAVHDLVTSADIGLLFLDRKLEVKLFTPRARELFDLTPADIGRPLAHLTHHLELDGLVDEAANMLHDPRGLEREVRSREGRAYLLRILPYRSSDDRVDGVVLTFHDVTNLEYGVRESDRRKDEFLATLSHELRNPLTPLRAALDLQRMCPDQLAATQAIMDRHIDQLVGLVDELLDLARVTQGKITLELKRHDARDIVRTSVDAARPQLGKHELVVVTGDEPILIDADLSRMIQVVSNLLANAMRFTPDGGRVRVEIAADRAHGVARLQVRDDGGGIAPEHIDDVFELFVQCRDDRGRARGGGLGIGLNLVRRIVELHGGQVAAHSDGEGRGSELVVEIPLARE